MKNVLEYLENTVGRVPDKVAYSDGTEDMTFAEVSRCAAAVGAYLLDKGAGGGPVAVLTGKHPHAIACFFGVVYAGGSYVPIDDEMPETRVGLILDNVRVRVIICDGSTYKRACALADEHGAEAVMCEDMFARTVTGADREALARVRRRQIDTDPIYMVFTSGSTGVPKGVAACHRSVIDYIEALSSTLCFDEDTVFGNQAPLYFDACLKELYPTVKFGATAYLIPKSNFMFPVKLVEFLNEHKINTVCWVVSALTMISSTGTFDTVKPEYLRTVAFGSEVFPPSQLKIWRQALPGCEFYNLYGPTECTGMSCFYHVTDELSDGEPVPIGEPFPNTDVMLLVWGEDGGARLAGDGEEGELCIRGTPLTLGYYNNAEETDRAFVQNPLHHHYHELIYRTGDIARYNERGQLVFVSRRDHQIKHMGHRIELGEIEYIAAACEGVTNVCCVYDRDAGKIVFFYTGTVDKRQLTVDLRRRLPRYMLPNVTVKLDEMMLTPNGKRDRRGLYELYLKTEKK